MNQILITEKVYVTPELKRKKKIYKANFILSVFLVCVLFSFYIYAEYDRNKSEEVSREILASIDLKTEEEEPDIEQIDIDDTTIKIEDNVLVVVLNERESNRQEIDVTKIARDAEEFIQNQVNNSNVEAQQEIYKTNSGVTYTTESILNIPSLEINYPVLTHLQYPYTTDELLKISITKFWGGKPNTVGNYVIVGHNYKNKKMFGKLSSIQNGDKIELTDLTGKTLTYEVYDKYKVSPEDTTCTSQRTEGRKEVTLITCTNYGTQRLIVKAKEVK